jgi:hypothetical protein
MASRLARKFAAARKNFGIRERRREASDLWCERLSADAADRFFACLIP